MVPGGHWERQRIRLRRHHCRPCQHSAGLIVPLVSPWQLGERDGALLQSWALEGVWDVRWPHGGIVVINHGIRMGCHHLSNIRGETSRSSDD
jgi:hypothetical protein